MIPLRLADQDKDAGSLEFNESVINMLAQLVAKEIFENGYRLQLDPYRVPVGVSAPHVHLCPEHLERLFGPGYELTPIRELQPGQYAAKEHVMVVGPKGVLPNVRVLGPLRDKTQVEISRTNAYVLGLDPPVRDSGDLSGSPGAVLVGPRGAVVLDEGVILAWRHIHMSPQHAERLGLKDRDVVKARTGGQRRVIFDRVLVRVSPSFRLEFHIDTDEANAAGLQNGDFVYIVPD